MIEDPKAIRFSNERVRPAADAIAQAYYNGKALLDQYDRQGIGPLYAPNEELNDGAHKDGRNVVVGANVTAFVELVRALIKQIEVDPNLAAVLAMSVNPKQR